MKDVQNGEKIRRKYLEAKNRERTTDYTLNGLHSLRRSIKGRLNPMNEKQFKEMTNRQDTEQHNLEMTLQKTLVHAKQGGVDLKKQKAANQNRRQGQLNKHANELLDFRDTKVTISKEFSRTSSKNISVTREFNSPSISK